MNAWGCLGVMVSPTDCSSAEGENTFGDQMMFCSDSSLMLQLYGASRVSSAPAQRFPQNGSAHHWQAYAREVLSAAAASPFIAAKVPAKAAVPWVARQGPRSLPIGSGR